MITYDTAYFSWQQLKWPESADLYKNYGYRGHTVLSSNWCSLGKLNQSEVFNQSWLNCHYIRSLLSIPYLLVPWFAPMCDACTFSLHCHHICSFTAPRRAETTHLSRSSARQFLVKHATRKEVHSTWFKNTRNSPFILKASNII